MNLHDPQSTYTTGPNTLSQNVGCAWVIQGLFVQKLEAQLEDARKVLDYLNEARDMLKKPDHNEEKS